MTSENHPYQPADDSGKPPLPKIKKMRWPFPIIWIVPVIAACLAGYYVEQHHQENGIEIAISFDDPIARMRWLTCSSAPRTIT
jgi:hypothetical protein